MNELKVRSSNQIASEFKAGWTPGRYYPAEEVEAWAGELITLTMKKEQHKASYTITCAFCGGFMPCSCLAETLRNKLRVAGGR